MASVDSLILWPSCPLHKKLPVSAWLFICCRVRPSGIKAEAGVGRDVLISRVVLSRFQNKRMIERVVAGAGGEATGLVAMPTGKPRNTQAPIKEAGDVQKGLTEQWDHHRVPST